MAIIANILDILRPQTRLAHKAIEKEWLFVEGEKEGPSLERKAKAAGQRGLINAISDLTGISVDHYAEVGLVGFVLLTDAVGGVEVCLNAAVNDEFSGANFPAGKQLELIRDKHSATSADGSLVEVGGAELTIYDNVHPNGEVAWRDRLPPCVWPVPHPPST